MSNWTMFGGVRSETLGAANAGTLIDNGGTVAHALGSWVTIGTTGFEYASLVLSGESYGTGATAAFLLDLGIGTAGSEVIIAQQLFFEAASVPQNFGMHLPLRVPAGVRLAARMRIAVNSGQIYLNVTGQAFEAPCPYPAGGRLVEMLNPNTADTTPAGTITQSGNSANESAWAQVVASTANRYVALWLAASIKGDASRTQSDFAFDIGIGASGSEVVLVENVAGMQEGSRIINPTIWGPFFCDIPAATRVAARVRCASSAADSFAVGVMGLVP